MGGPLDGVKVVELGGIGPGPHAGMLLADLGADIVRIERPTGGLQVLPDQSQDAVLRGRRSVAVDLRNPEDLAATLRLLDAADVLLDGFRPGVTDRLGLGPEDLMRRNPRLVYGRITGWGAEGPLSRTAGHDINYLSVTGVLNAIRLEGSRPTVPLNLVGDYGGGSLYLVLGVVSALYDRERTGKGQVIDAAIVDGVANLAQAIWSMRAQGVWSDESGSNLLDSGAPYYDTYECADGRFVAVGALEPQFYAELLQGLNLDPVELPLQNEREGWPRLRERFAASFATRTRDEWTAIFEGTDACVTPVLSFSEAYSYPHLVARETLVSIDGVIQAAPAPRFSRSHPVGLRSAPARGSSELGHVAAEWLGKLSSS